MEREKIERFMDKFVKILADVGDNKVFCYNGTITDVSNESTSIFNVKYGETILSNTMIKQITQNYERQ